MARKRQRQEEEEEEEYEVEEICGRRVRKGFTEYSIKWKGYDGSTWTAEKDLEGCKELVAEYNARQTRSSTVSSDVESETQLSTRVPATTRRKRAKSSAAGAFSVPRGRATRHGADNAGVESVSDRPGAIAVEETKEDGDDEETKEDDDYVSIRDSDTQLSTSAGTTTRHKRAKTSAAGTFSAPRGRAARRDADRNAGVDNVIDRPGAIAVEETKEDGDFQDVSDRESIEYDYGDDGDEYIVEDLLDKRIRNGLVEYLVQWAGGSYAPSWEPVENLSCDDLIRAYEARLASSEALTERSKSHRHPEISEARNVAISNSGATQSPRHPQTPPTSSRPRPEERPRSPPRPTPPRPPVRLQGPPRPTTPTAKIGLERSFINKLVAYSPASDPWLKEAAYSKVGSTFIVGRVCDYKYTKKKGLYEIRWVESMFQRVIEHVDVAIIKRGLANMEKLRRATGTPRWLQLCRPDPENAVDVGGDFDELEVFEASDESAPATLAEVEKIKSIRFEPDKPMRAPALLYSHDDGSSTTRVKPEFNHIFEHSASSSFFAYLPLYFWKQVLEHTNDQGKELYSVTTPFTMDELMKFLGIMWFMALVDKGEYANYWGDQVESAVFGTTGTSLDQVMPLRRFKQLRSAFCFRKSASISPADIDRDSAVRVRTVLNMLKQTGGRYVDVGRNLAVDEASVAARSKYARHIIVYNPNKPTGKYHFKLYMCCCATSWIALSYRLHCQSTLQDRAAGVYDEASTTFLEDQMATTSSTRQIVLEITRPFYGSGRIVNCDNFYTSVQLLEALRLKKLFCRGTVKESSKHFPRHVVLPEPNKSEKNANKSKNKRRAQDGNEGDANAAGGGVDPPTPAIDRASLVSGEVKRGDFLQAVSQKPLMLAASWCDGNIVTIISNADSSTATTVQRLIKGEKRPVPAPLAIKEYNKYMQGVDRNDQVRARFSVADGHSFKKWHKKLGFAIVDVARVNAYLTRRLCRGDESDERDAHRAFVTEIIQEMFTGKWQDAPSDDVMLFDDAPLDTGRQSSPGRTPTQSETTTPAAFASPDSAPCSDMASAQVFSGHRRKRTCIVCRFEGRADTIVTTACLTHHVSLCKRVYVDDARMFGCQRADWSCWDKYHSYYLPQGVFSTTGSVRTSSKDYKEKVRQERATSGQERATSGQERAPSGPVQPVSPQRAMTFTERLAAAWTPALGSPPPSASSTPGRPLTPYTPGSATSAASSFDYV